LSGIGQAWGYVGNSLFGKDKIGDAFLVRIITDDETWVHCEPECNQQIKEWKHPHSPIRKKFKSQPSAGKLMLTVFLGLTRPNTGTLSGEGFNIILSCVISVVC